MDSIRKVLEQSVCAYNSPLKDVVSSMDIIVLLRNAHPIDRTNLTFALYRNGKISKAEAKEFVTFL